MVQGKDVASLPSHLQRIRVDAPAPLSISTSPSMTTLDQTQQTSQKHPRLRCESSEEHELLKLLHFLTVPSNNFRNKRHENLQILNLQAWVPRYYPSILFNWFSFSLISSPQ